MLVSQALEKKLDVVQDAVIAPSAKLADERVRKEIVDALRLVEGAKTKLRNLLVR